MYQRINGDKKFFLSFSLNVDDADAVVGVGVDVVDVVDVVDDRTIFWIQCYQTFFATDRVAK